MRAQDRARRARQQEDNEANRRAAAENALHKRMHQEQLRRSVRQEQSAEVHLLPPMPKQL